MKRFIILTMILPIMSSCATVFSSHPQTVGIKSDPSGATYQFGPYSGHTPDTIQASRKELAHTVNFTKVGYEDKTVAVATTIQGVTWVNFLFWPGFIVDFVTGNAYKLETSEITTSLETKSKK